MNGTKINPLALKQLRDNWSWYFMIGLGFVALGMLALYFSLASTIISVIYLGIIFIAVGLFEGAFALKINQWGSYLLHLFLCVVFVIGGAYMIYNPVFNAISLTLFLAILFVISGIARIFTALTQHVPHKTMLLFNGILSLALGILIWYQWPSSGLWVIGMFLGINLLFTGWTLILLSWRAKQLNT